MIHIPAANFLIRGDTCSPRFKRHLSATLARAAHTGRVHPQRIVSLSLLAATLAACTQRIPEITTETAETAGTTGSSSLGGSSAPDITTGNGDPGPTLDVTGADESTSTSTTTTTTTIPDLWSQPEPCDIWAQDCPPGEKCGPHTVPDGGYLDTWCVPVARNPNKVGDPCMLTDSSYTGLDDCEAGAFCWTLDVAGGVCLAVCTGPSASPTCDDMHECTIFEPDVLPLCIDRCHPLAQDCDPGETCVPTQQNLDFMCVPAAPQGDSGLHAPCESGNTCDPGLHCAYWKDAVECAEASGRCCEPFCDLGAANSCPGQGQLCEPWYPEGQAPEGFENVGTCAAPP